MQTDSGRIDFEPRGATILIECDWTEGSVLEIQAKKPKIMPSGVVIAVGPGALNSDGTRTPPNLQVGDHVLVVNGSMAFLPLSRDPRVIIAQVNEDHVMGLLGPIPDDHPFMWPSEKRLKEGFIT